eukprot:TRINITY_DN2257_c0_g1_i13.p1 TRINITY_DN2257_c0_g1~~TRINITY_DN2257_c0_g1_i13.p1  ORF type:complete len:585 (-),score=162.06 TRINITY_DN2257_c0_g1_i13:73-1797(-)
MLEEGASDSATPSSNKLGIPAGCNPSDVLYKLAHSRGIKPPVFEMISEQGPPHARTYTWSCSFWDGKYQTMAAGRSKKEAKNAVAKALLDQVDVSVLPTRPPPRIKPDKKRKAPGEDIAGGPPGIKGKKGGNVPGFWTGGAMGMGPPAAKFRFGGPPGPMGGRFGPGAGMRPRNSREDQQVITKHRKIYPTQEELGTILKLTETVERALKRVSDKFVTPAVKPEVKEEKDADEKKNGDDGKENRDILGVARTGDLAKGLLLTGDRTVELVVMCREKPTLPLLAKVGEGLKEEVKTIPEPEKKGKIIINDGELEVVVKPRDAALLIKYKKEEDTFNVFIVLTCTKLRQTIATDNKENGDAASDVEIKKEGGGGEENNGVPKEDTQPDPHDMLPKEKCLNALAELRRAKWFSSMASPLESCVESIRIFREICRRVEAWQALSNWAVELLVERAVSTSDMPLSPHLAINRVLEAVSTGLLAKDGPGLKDPCEREDIDTTANLDAQQREDLQSSAQEFLRKVHFRKIYEVLDLPKPEYKPRPNFKNKNKDKKEEEEGGSEAAATSEEPAVKKVKTEKA